MKTKFDENYLKMARIWASNSRARRRKVGALLVKDNRIISDGYNGTPSGFDNDCEIECCSAPYLYVCEADIPKDCYGCGFYTLKTKREVLHAESNAITKIAKSNISSEGSTLYVTCCPCIDCAKLIIQAGIVRVVYIEDYKDNAGLKLLIKAGIEVEQINIDE